MTVLLIWQLLPESIEFYLIDVKNEEEKNLLLKCNNKFINCTNTNEHEMKCLCILSDALCKDSLGWTEESTPEWRGKWSDNKIDLPIQTKTEILIITSGMII